MNTLLKINEFLAIGWIRRWPRFALAFTSSAVFLHGAAHLARHDWKGMAVIGYGIDMFLIGYVMARKP